MSGLIPIVNNVNCSLAGEQGPVCFQFAICDAITRDCQCRAVPFSLCSQPLIFNSTSLQQNYLAIKGIILGCQAIIVILAVWLCLWHARKRGKLLVLPSREQAALVVVMCSAIVNILYVALDPFYWRWLLPQPAWAAVIWLGDLYLAFLAAGYGLMAGLWLSIRSTPLSAGYEKLVWVSLAVLIGLPFLASIICLVIRCVGAVDDLVVPQYFFFAILVFVSLVYGIVVVRKQSSVKQIVFKILYAKVVAGIRALRSLAKVKSVHQDQGRKALFVQVTRHVKKKPALFKKSV